MMNAQRKIAMSLLNAVWNEDATKVKDTLRLGADPSWIFNGYPILIHAVCVGNEEIVNILIAAGAVQTSEAFGFALERGIGRMIRLLLYKGILPKHFEPREGFGYYPQRFAY